MMTSLTRWVLAHRKLVVGMWAVVTVAGFAAIPQVSFDQKFSVPGREGWETSDQIKKVFKTGGENLPLLPVVQLPAGKTVSSPGVKEDLAKIDAAAKRALPTARIASYASTGDKAFASKDGRTAFALVYPVAPNTSFGEDPVSVKKLRAALRGTTVAGSAVHLTGFDALAEDVGQDSGGTGVLLESVIGGLGALAVLAFVFASLMAFLPLLMAIIAIPTTFLLVWGLTSVTDMSPIVQFLIALVGLGIAIDYALIIVVRWREERAHGHDVEEATIRAMNTAGRAVVFSGTTVGIALLALVFLPLPFLRSVGYAGLLIPTVSTLVAITLLPVILSKWGAKLDWPHKRNDDNASRAWTRWAQGIVRHRWIAAGGALLVLAALTLAATNLNLGTSNPDTIAKKGDANVGLKLLKDSGVGSGALAPYEVVVPEAQAAAVVQRATAVGKISGASAPADAAWRRDGLAIVDAFPTPNPATKEARDLVDPLRAAVHQVPEAKLSGAMATNDDFIDAVYGNFPLMLLLLGIVTFLLLARAFRSLLLPLKAVILNLVSVAAAWGVMTLVWQNGHGSQLWGIDPTGSISSWIPLIVFVFLFGLSMDYEVFILSRLRAEYDRTGRTATSVIVGLGRTGRLVTSAALILFLAFASMASGPGVEVKVMATGLAAGILLDATVIRGVLVPAVVALFGRWNWWLPPGPAKLLRVEPSVPPRTEPAIEPA